ncbi:MAG: hypothetical protein ACRDN6_01075 [Gaiellaceae bacterium]
MTAGSRMRWPALAGLLGVVVLTAGLLVVLVDRDGPGSAGRTTVPLERPQPQPSPRHTYTVPQVRDAFRRQTGLSLVVFHEASTADVTSLRSRPHFTPRFGEFQIFVFRPAAAARMSRVFTNGVRPDGNGVSWVSDRVGGWIAVTRFGANLAVGWFPTGGERRVDSRWRRLDDVVRRFP